MTDNIQDLISLQLAGQASSSEEKYLFELIQKDEAVRKLWEERCAHHNSPAINNAYRNVDRQAAWEAIDSLTTSRRRPAYRVLKIVAAACVTIAVGVYTFTSFHSSNHNQTFDNNTARLVLANGEVIDLSKPKNNTIAIPNGPTVNNHNRSLTYNAAAGSEGMNTLWAPAGSDYKIVLSDGTEVFLNSMTKLTFPFKFTGKNREITIDGEAYLKVAKNASMPFIVRLPQGDITVLGTEFNLNTYDHQRTSVALVNGSVKVQIKNETTVLKPGYQAVYNERFQTNEFDSKEVLSWREGLHLFSNASLEEIVKVLPRWYGVSVVLDNAASAKNRFTGYIDRNRPIGEFLKEMKITTEADYYYDEKQVLHFR